MPGETPSERIVAVVGGGISGLVAARVAAATGARVTLFEASERLGGLVRTVDVDGARIDLGAEAMHLSPNVSWLVDELRLRDSMIVAQGTSSWIYTTRGLRKLPPGVGPAGPTRLRPVLSSGTMTVPGLARAGLEPLRGGPALDLAPGHDISVAEFVDARFGREVTQTFVDPLLGSLHAGDIRRLSLRATAPTLLPAALSGESVVRRSRRARKAGRVPPMSFVTWADGLEPAVSRALDGTDVHVRLGASVERVERAGYGVDTGFRLTLNDGSHILVDGVVLAVPAAIAARLLTEMSPTASATLATTETASVATVLLGIPSGSVAGQVALTGSGVLVPSAVGTLLKAATFLSAKWPHLRGDTFWIRLSAGRAGDSRLAMLDDAGLVDHLRRDLRMVSGVDAAPTHSVVARWPHSMPQLTVGHPDRLHSVRAALATQAPGLALAGSSYDGIGLAACIGSGRAAGELASTHPE